MALPWSLWELRWSLLELHLINVSLEEAEEKLIEVSLPWALVLMRELEDQIGRLDIELNGIC